MMRGREIGSGIPHEAVLAQLTMSSDDKSKKSSLKKNWDPNAPSAGKKLALFTPEEMDIYCNKITREVFIFHGKTIDYDSMDYLEYDAKDYSVDVVMKDGTRMDLGVKLQWLVRPYFTKAPEIMVVQTKDGESINGTSLPLKHKEKK
jgi:hypothetical protein